MKADLANLENLENSENTDKNIKGFKGFVEPFELAYKKIMVFLKQTLSDLKKASFTFQASEEYENQIYGMNVTKAGFLNVLGFTTLCDQFLTVLTLK